MVAAFTLVSPAFAGGDSIPAEYTCDGLDISPPLEWGGVPEGTVSLALVCDDPDAPVGTWVHWVIFDIPPGTTSLPAGVPADTTLADGAVQGRNSWGRTGYGGPCPPFGTHRYYFRLYALDTCLGLPPRTGSRELARAMEGHVLGVAELMGTYRRHR